MSDAYIRQNGACAAENLERQIQNDFIHAANVPNAFKYYSGNNECPLENELESLKSEYSAMTSSIIRNTRRNIASRKKTQLKLNILKNAFKSVLSPLRRLPIEVLGYVFEFCVPWVFDYPLYPLRCTQNNTGILWVLSRVSHGWRQAVLAHPILWSYVVFDDRVLRTAANHEEYTNALQLVLRRSRGAPLRLSTHVYQDYSSHLVSLLAAESGRIVDLDLSGNCNTLAALTRATFPALTSLFLHLSPPRGAGISTLSLRMPALLRYTQDGQFDIEDVPWHQLIDCALGECSFRGTRRMRDVEKLQLDGPGTHSVHWRGLNSVHLDRLRSLEVIQEDAGEESDIHLVDSFFKAFHTPNLRRLIIIYKNCRLPATHLPFPSQISHFFLAASAWDIPILAFLSNVFFRLPNIRYLAFGFHIDPDFALQLYADALGLLIGHRRGAILLPKVECLRLPLSLLGSLAPSLGNLITSRMNKPNKATPLREIQFYCEGNWENLRLRRVLRRSRPLLEADPTLRIVVVRWFLVDQPGDEETKCVAEGDGCIRSWKY